MNADALPQLEKQLRILSRVTQKINENLDIGVIMRTLVEAALELTGCSDGAAGLHIDGQMVFREYYAHGEWVPIDFSFPPGYGVPGWVLEKKAPYISNDTRNDPVVIPEIRDQLGFYNLADTPILDRNGNLLGCFEIHNTENARPFDESDIDLLKALSSSAAVAMENATIIDDLRKTEQQLRRSKSYLRSLFEQSPVSLWEEDFSGVRTRLDALRRQGVDDVAGYLREHPEVVAECARLAKVTMVNKATVELFEAASEDDLLSHLDQVFTPESLDVFCEELICLIEGDCNMPAVGINKTLGGREIIVQVKWSVLPEYEESWEKVIVSMIDVTHERKIDQMKNEFISIAAHELRTPLSAMMGYAELLQMVEAEHLAPDQRRDCLQSIYDEGVALERIIDDLLDVGKIESGRALVIDKTEVNLTGLLEKICKAHQRETGKHTIELVLPDDDISLHADHGRLSQVLDNLLSNAIKYSPGGGPIRVAGSLEPGRVNVSVSDSGIGMTELQLQRAFEKFYRADSSNTAVRGLGLGLNIARNIIEAHGGTIRVESAVDKGTTVLISLPAS